MSKERLEEIKEDVFKCNHGSTRGYSYEQLYHIALSLVRIHGEWLIKQAERVQELEDELIVQKECFEELQNNHIRVCNQNKRYREAIEETLQAMGMVDRQEYGKTLERVLEVEE